MSNEPSHPGCAPSTGDERQERIVQILDEYMAAAERGESISPSELLAQHPGDASQLRGYLSGLKLLQNAAAQTLDPAFFSPGAAQADATNPEATDADATDRRIGDFRILREVGRGGMGVVYEAEQVSLTRRVALKVLPRLAAYDQTQLHRFRIESTAAASIEHPHIVPVYAIGEEHGVHFYAMQFIDGKSLAELIDDISKTDRPAGFATTVAKDSTTPMSVSSAGRSASSQTPSREFPSCQTLPNRALRDHVRRIAQFGVEAADALHAAHSYGVVHRDVKPSNLLIDANDKLWVADFGLARRCVGSDLTQTGDILGTLRYMSPEQALGRGHLMDHRTDVFSLGVTLYEAACWQHPIAEGDTKGVAHEWRHVRPIRQIDRRIPADFETIILKCQAEAPADRYASAADLADDLRRYLADEPILARRPGVVSRVGKWALRHRRTVASAAAAAIIAFAAVSTALVVVAREQNATETHLLAAQRDRQQLRKVLDELGSELAEQLAAVPGAEGIRYQLLQKSLQYYKQIAQQAADDPTLATDVALAHSKMGELHERLGEQQEALAEHRRARDLLDEQLRQSPDDPNLLRGLAVSLNNVGALLSSAGNYDEAFFSCQRALEIQQRLAPDSPESLSDQAATYTNLGVVHKSRGDLDQAADAFTTAEKLHERMEDDSPTEEARRRRALGFLNLASIFETSDAAQAGRHYDEAIRLQTDLLEDHPHNPIYLSDLARSHNNKGYLEATRAKWSSAEALYRKALKVQRRLVDSMPAVAGYRRDLAVSQNNLGMALTQSNKLDRSEPRFGEAERLFGEAAQQQEKLLKASPGDVQTLSALGGITNNMGMLHQAQEDWSQARGFFEQAVAYQSKALQNAAHSAHIRELLSNHLSNLAESSYRAGDTNAAIDAAIRRQTLWPDSPSHLLGVARQLVAFRRHAARPAALSDRPPADRLLVVAGEAVQAALDSGHA
ncbi:MAG: protein kinase, partial [Planctomycetota bacterium]